MGAALAASPALASAAPSVGVVGSSVLVRPADAPATSSTAVLTAAGNEFESVQVVLHADAAAPLTGVDVSIVGQLVGPGGATIPAANLTVYRVGYYDVTGLPSDGDLGGALGSFPDILIPKVDAYWLEPRRAFPIDVPAAQNRLAWVDVLAPAGAAAGSYTGASIHVTADGGFARDIPIALTVADLDLPSTPSLGGGFDINVNQLCRAHDCASYPGGQAGLHKMYQQIAFDDRLTLAKPPTPTPSGPDDPAYRAWTRPLILGTSDARLRGAQLTTITIYGWGAESADEWRRAADADAFTGRVRFHCDEVGTSATMWAACRRDWTRANALWRGAAAAGAAVSDLPLEVTTGVDEVNWARANGFGDVVDRIAVLIPLINRVHPKAGGAAFPGRRAEFDGFASGTTVGGVARQLWSYSSCASMGCSPASADIHPEWTGWPSYGVDQPASEARAMGWVSYEYDVRGEYYYETTRDLPTAWTDLWSDDGGNHGDGTLFYPGTVARVGGTHDVALESMRLKRIRDGREDYELLTQAAAASSRAAVVAIARGAIPSAQQADTTQTKLDDARAELFAVAAGKAPRLPLEPVPPSGTTRTIRGGGGATGGAGTGAGGGTGAAGAVGTVGGTPQVRVPVQSNGRAYTCGGRRATIVGTNRGERIVGTTRADVIVALGGNDRIIGRGGADIICGGTGNDTIATSGDRTRDTVICGAGRDALTHERRDRVRAGCERRTRRG